VKPRPPLPAGAYLIVGLARSGTAAGLALRARGETVIGVDIGAPAGARGLAEAGVELHLGEDGIALLDRVGAIVKSPGVPAQAPVIVCARARGLPVLGELEVGWRLLENELIAVTGTNGKTTTVELIGHIYRTAGLPVAVAGNVGAALSGLVGEVDGDVSIVCEASSFQLEDTIDFAPEAAVLLNIAPDHLDRHGTFEAYRDAKLQIFARQRDGDIAVVPAGFEIPARTRGAGRLVSFGGELPDRRGGPGAASVTLDERAVAEDAGVAVEGAGLGADRGATICWQGRAFLNASELRLRGKHNVQNAMAAAAVCLARGLEPEAVREGLRTFAGVAHRLEEVARRHGVLYVNDSKATNVASTLVALEAFPGAPVHLILGGQGKDQDFSALREPVGAACRAVYLIGEDAGLLSRVLDHGDVPVHQSGSLDLALARATRAAVDGDVVLLSPACASFDQFADFEARGERFREFVIALE
jgi:UDP-N-acetylmuramoylalanine--D-glutamate ligase